ncbi:50S ribosomal protein L15 [Adhaeribacter radiodurans]|uniref:Large ribosomal subunit protein uL15 n=1 Tax=Adhaeribacter radiodurans TaxID=2745197 RepID=A0A7L7LBP8_9BACT|nr:50S ribosomal protein L15 [Adhaeribacter radiodurans]QMU30256.1 50S ribosomal protein L15 [Adhaeribacter radiodurans]
MNLSSLQPAAGSIKDRKRIGRGTGSGRGGTSTRGHKGAKSRSGYSSKVGFEGGQMPLQRRVPKFGFKNFNRVEFTPVNIDVISSLIANNEVKVVDFIFLKTHGLVSKNAKVKVLGRGTFDASIEVQAHAFSQSAIEAIEKAGGKTVVVI